MNVMYGNPNKPAHAPMRTQASDDLTEWDGWNGTSIKAKDPYALMRDCNANCRYGLHSYLCSHIFQTVTNTSCSLTAQHYLWKDLLGYLLHPDIPTRASDLKVADVATGNG